LGAAADVIERDVTLDADRHRRIGALARQRSALEVGRPCFHAAVDRRMNCDSHVSLPSSKQYDAANGFARMHEIESLVDVGERHRVRDQIVDVDLAVHVPVDDLRHIGAAARSAERGAFPHAPGYQLERTRLDLLARARDADDDRDTPAAMTALECLTHEIDVADALEAVVGTAVSYRDQVLHEIAADFLRIDEIDHPELLGERAAPRIEIDTDDAIRTDELRA